MEKTNDKSIFVILDAQNFFAKPLAIINYLEESTWFTWVMDDRKLVIKEELLCL